MAAGLAYVGKVVELLPISGADRIESAVVVCGSGGKWAGVVRKGDFSIGDACTTILQDAVVPPSDRWSFLENSNWRVRMARFRGAPSECVIVRGAPDEMVGVDLTAALGITKYEKPIPVGMAGDPVGSFPSFIPKTDEPNFQTVSHLVEALRGKPYVVTVKADGSSGTAYRRGDHFGVCSRNWELKEGPNAYWHVAKKFDLENTLPDGYAVQFEVVGPGIQKNPLGLKEVTGLAFNVWSMELNDYLCFDAARDFCAAINLPMVVVVEFGDAFDYSNDELRTMAEGNYETGKPREGIVIRSADGGRHANERISFKVINLAYQD